MTHTLYLFLFFSFASFFQLKAQQDPTVEAKAPLLSLDFVVIANPDNPPDPKSYYGAVSLPFLLQRNTVTTSQYCLFLNSVASIEDPHHLYDERMFSDAVVHAIKRTYHHHTKTYHYSVVKGQEEKPIVYINYLSAIRFCNWLHNEQQGPEATETGAYTLPSDEMTAIFPTKNEGARYFLPSPDQWYKATYFDPSLPPPSYSYPSAESLPTWTGSYGLVNLLAPFQFLDSVSSSYGPYSLYGPVPFSGLPAFSANDLGFRIAAPL